MSLSVIIPNTADDGVKPAVKIIHRQTAIPLYSGWVHLFLGPTFAELQGEIATVFPLDAETLAQCSADISGAVIYGRGKELGIALIPCGLTHNTVAHEVFHLTHRILEGVGHHLSPTGHEPHAYLCGWLTNWLYWEIENAGLAVQGVVFE